MNTLRLKPFLTASTYATALSTLSVSLLFAQSTEQTVVLEPYAASSQAIETALPQPHTAQVSGVYGQSESLSDIPRAVSILPEAQAKALGIRDYADLYKTGAGTMRPNYLGVAGTPYLRGDDAGLFFSGMQRAYQLLAFPQSFNNASAQVIVKGPAPAHFGATQAGGYVNQVAKRYDPNSNALSASIGSNNNYAAQADYSGTTTVGKRVWEYRLSTYAQDSDTFFRDAQDDRRSLYGSFETKLNPRATLFSAFEVYQWAGNENPGWNRLTQGLINNGTYITGEPANAATTTTLSPDQVLISPDDLAKATDIFYFLETRYESDPDRSLSNKVFVEYFNADKRSPSNDFAFSGKSFVIEDKLTLTQEMQFLNAPTTLDSGASVRFNQINERFGISGTLDAVAIQDISQRVGNTGPAAFNQISQGTHWTGALFTSARTQWTDAFETFAGLRLESTRFDADTVMSAFGANTPRSGGKNYYNVELSPVWHLSTQHSLYGTLQHGTALMPGEGGAVTSENNFGETELYEVGLKSVLWEGKLFNTFALYHWDKGAFNTRAGASEQFRSNGFEWELNYQPRRQLAILGALTAQRTYRRGNWPDRLGAFNAAAAPTHAFVGGATKNANNPDSVVPGTPEVQAKLFALLDLDNGIDLGGGAIWSDGFYTSYDRLFRVPSSIVFSGFVGYAYKDWSVRLDGENLTDELYFTGSDPNFFGNALLTPAAGRSFRLSLTRSF